MGDPASEVLRDVFTYEQYRWVKVLHKIIFLFARIKNLLSKDVDNDLCLKDDWGFI